MEEEKHSGLNLEGTSHILPSRPLAKGPLHLPPDRFFTGGSVPCGLHEHTTREPADVKGSSHLLLPGDHKASPLTSPDLCYLNIHKDGGQFGSHHSILQTLKQDASCGSYISLPGSEVKSIVRHQQQVCEKEAVTLNCSVDKAFRTAVMFISFFALGLVNGILGPTLIELQTIASTTTTKTALLFTWGAVGRIPGSLGTAFVFDKYSPSLLLGGAVFLLATSTCLLPWCYKYSVMATVIVVQGIGIGSLGSGCTAYCFQLWTTKAAPFVQALGFIMALGNTCAPLLAKPFLSQSPLPLTPSDLNLTFGDVTTLGTPQDHLSGVMLLNDLLIESGANISEIAAARSAPLNQVKAVEEVKPEQFSVWNASYTSNVLGPDVPKIAPPFLIISALHLLSSLLYMVVYVHDKTKTPKFPQSTQEVSVSLQAIPNPMPINSNLLCVLFGIFMFCCAGLEVTYGGLLLTYVVEYLSWTKSLAAYLTFAYWMCVACGRGIGVILVKYLSPPTIVTADIIGACASLVLLAACSHLHVIVQWVCTCLLGLSISTLVAATLNLAYRYLQLSGKLTAIFMCCNYAGIMVLPGVTGALFRRVSGQAFIFSQMVTTAVMISVFISIQVYYHKLSHHCTSDDEDNDEVDEEDEEQADSKHYTEKSRYLTDV